jgi:hypothetical protein
LFLGFALLLLLGAAFAEVAGTLFSCFEREQCCFFLLDAPFFGGGGVGVAG